METFFNKDGFILYASHWPAINILSDTDKGKLLEMLFDFHINGTIGNTSNPTLKAIFCLMQHQMETDNKKYKEIVKKNIEKANKRWKTEKGGKMPLHADKDKDKDKVKDKDKDLNNNIDYYIDCFNKIRESKFRIPAKVERQFNARLSEGYTADDMLAALQNAMLADYHKTNGFKFLTPEFFTRADKIELYSAGNSTAKITNQINGKPVSLGMGEWIENNQRFYGTKEKPYMVPIEAPPRPDLNHFYDGERGKWVSIS